MKEAFMSALEGIKADAAAWGIMYDPHDRAHPWVVTCSVNGPTCLKSRRRGYSGRIPPEGMKKFALQAGWELHKNKKPICPNCQHLPITIDTGVPLYPKATRNGYNNPMPVVTPSLVPPITPEVSMTATAGPTPDLKIARRVFILLDDHFNIGLKTYDDFWNDERIAKEADTAIDVVIKLRRDFYGELAVSPELQALRDELTALRQLADGLTDQTKIIQSEITKVNERLLDAIRKRVA